MMVNGLGRNQIFARDYERGEDGEKMTRTAECRARLLDGARVVRRLGALLVTAAVNRAHAPALVISKLVRQSCRTSLYLQCAARGRLSAPAKISRIENIGSCAQISHYGVW